MRPRAAELLSLEYFEAEPASMPTEVFDQHHILLNLKDEAHRVENWRDGAHRDFVYNKLEIIITPAGVQSGWRWHAKSRVIVVTIEPEKLERFVAHEMGLILSPRQLTDVPQTSDPELVEAGRMLVDALRDRGPGSEVVYEGLARVFLVKLVQKYGDFPVVHARSDQGLSTAQYRRVIDYIAEHFHERVTIEDMAKQAAMSPSHFSRMFQASLGDSPYQFLMDYRVEQAKKLLARRDVPLIDVALRCGFSDQPHLTRVFKRLTGMTPKAFRAHSQQESSKTE